MISSAMAVLKNANAVQRNLEMKWAMKGCIQYLNEIEDAQRELNANKNFQFSFDDKKDIEAFLDIAEAVLGRIGR